MNHYQIKNLEWNTAIIFENFNETQSYLKMWLKHYHIWKFEWNTIIFDYLNESQSNLKFRMKHYNIRKFEWYTTIFEKFNETLSYLNIWKKHNPIWNIEWNAIIFENFNNHNWNFYVRRVLELTFVRVLPELSYGCLKNTS